MGRIKIGVSRRTALRSRSWSVELSRLLVATCWRNYASLVHEWNWFPLWQIVVGDVFRCLDVDNADENFSSQNNICWIGCWSDIVPRMAFSATMNFSDTIVDEYFPLAWHEHKSFSLRLVKVDKLWMILWKKKSTCLAEIWTQESCMLDERFTI